MWYINCLYCDKHFRINESQIDIAVDRKGKTIKFTRISWQPYNVIFVSVLLFVEWCFITYKMRDLHVTFQLMSLLFKNQMFMFIVYAIRSRKVFDSNWSPVRIHMHTNPQCFNAFSYIKVVPSVNMPYMFSTTKCILHSIIQIFNHQQIYINA